MRARETRHDRGNAVQAAVFGADTGQAMVIGAGEQAVAVTGQHRVDARHQ